MSTKNSALTSHTKLKKAVAEAQHAFWEKVQELYPDAQSSTFDESLLANLEKEMETAIQHWVDMNTNE